MSARNKGTPYVRTEDGSLFVKVKAIMTPICAYIDGLTLWYFGKGGTPYLPVQTAIDWCRKEASFHDREKYDRMVDELERALRASAVGQ